MAANAQTGAGQTGSRGIENWQEQAAAQQAATGHQSRIFGRKDAERPQKPVLGGISRIFRKDRDEAYDGLVDRMPTGPAAREREKKESLPDGFFSEKTAKNPLQSGWGCAILLRLTVLLAFLRKKANRP